MTVASVAQAWTASSEAGLPLRMAQRAFAVLLETGGRGDAGGGEFVMAQLRVAARRTLSALSADEQSVLSRWLSLQLATSVAPDTIAHAGGPLTRVDAMLAAGIAATLPRTREELLAHARKGAAAA
jgi:hypothetical protein